jgi:hypothetical protein
MIIQEINISLIYPVIPITPKFIISNYQMPLAVYREVAAHLEQVEGIKVAFLAPADRKFSYADSQLAGLEITGVDQLVDADRLQVERLLRYYADCYHEWEINS